MGDHRCFFFFLLCKDGDPIKTEMVYIWARRKRVNEEHVSIRVIIFHQDNCDLAVDTLLTSDVTISIESYSDSS